MKTYDSVLMDWDGNIAQTLDVWLDAYRQVLVSHGHNLSDEEIGTSFGSLNSLAQELGISDYKDVMQEADDIATRRLPYVELYPDAIEVLDYLHDSGKEIALITSSSRNHIEGLIKRYNLSKFFSFVVTGDDITHHKPHPEPIEKAIQGLGAVREKSVLIGDSDKDLGAAINSGLDSILFYPPEHRKFYDIGRLALLKPTYVIEDFTEIKEIIK